MCPQHLAAALSRVFCATSSALLSCGKVPHRLISWNFLYTESHTCVPPAINIKLTQDKCFGCTFAHRRVACRYASRIKLIEHRKEVVDGMTSEMIELFKLFREKNQGVKPESIVVYRDGVSHGEFKEVRHCAAVMGEAINIRLCLTHIRRKPHNWYACSDVNL
jgi:hypothetical protein